MLEVQDYLRSGKTLADLEETFGITNKRHEDLPLVILNYNQINCPMGKTHPITMECRGLVLEENTWELVAKGFTRFFNYLEAPLITDQFNWNKPFTAYRKEDGSFMMVYNYRGQWFTNTKNSFGNLGCFSSGKTWQELLEVAFDNVGFAGIDKLCDEFSYVFEFCSPYNKVVRYFEKPTVRLIGIFSKTGFDVPCNYVDFVASTLNVPRPEKFTFSNIEEVQKHLENLEKNDPTDEGLVLRDCNNIRIKVKNKKYLALHRMKGETNIFYEKNLLPFILDGETDELLAYFPEVEEKVSNMQVTILNILNNLKDLLEKVKDIEDQKEYALAITKSKLPMFYILFQMKHESDFSVETLEEKFYSDHKNILKHVLKIS